MKIGLRALCQMDDTGWLQDTGNAREAFVADTNIPEELKLQFGIDFVVRITV